MRAVKKLFGYRIGKRAVAVGAVAVLLLTLIPLVRLAFYAVPWYDDYLYGRFVKSFLGEECSLLSALRGALYCTKTEWYAYQGTYSSVFLMALVPTVWGEKYYFLGPLFIMALLLLGCFLLIGVLLRHVLRTDDCTCIALQALMTTAVFMLIYTAQGGFYWYNGGLHYVGMHGFGMMLAAVCIRLMQAQKRGEQIGFLVLSVLLALVAAGSNFVTCLQGLLIVLSLTALAFLTKRRRGCLLLLPLAAYAFGFYKNIGAPGNAVRASEYVGWGYSSVEAVLYSFVEAGKYLWEFTGWIGLAVLVLLVPLIWQLVGEQSFRFRYPALVLLWSFCLYAAGFTPSLYSLGHAGLSRTLNAVKITYMLLLFLNEVYWLGWLRQHLADRRVSVGDGRVCWWFYPAVGVLMLFIFATASNQAGNYSAYGAYYYVHTGEAYNFHQEYLQRVALFQSGERNVVVEPYHYRPWFLCSSELSDDPGAEQNRAVASWYGLESVRCLEKDAE